MTGERMKTKKISIVGGGASGMMAAIVAAQKGAIVTIYEKNDRVGKKLLATGNGKCNFSNLSMNNSCYRGGGEKIVGYVLEQFSPRDCIAFFQELGMLVKERNGYLYPASEQASTVLDLLRNKLSYLGVNVVTGCEITGIKYKKEKRCFYLSALKEDKKETIETECVILSTGSVAGISTKKNTLNMYRLLEKLNLPIVPVVPSLVQLRCKEDYMKAVAGVRLEGEVSLYIDQKEICTEHGELQLTDYGVSGIPVFQLSRYAAYALQEKKDVQVRINCLPNFSNEDYDIYIKKRKIQSKEQTAEEFFLGLCNKKLILLFLKLAQIKPTDLMCDICDEKKQKVFKLMRKWSLNIVSTNPFEQAQVCAGGLSMDAVDAQLQVKEYPGLYVTGELLDVDGRCGGYNLQWAFSSGYAAGTDAAESKF